jgi:hypothetical protein
VVTRAPVAEVSLCLLYYRYHVKVHLLLDSLLDRLVEPSVIDREEVVGQVLFALVHYAADRFVL